MKKIYYSFLLIISTLVFGQNSLDIIPKPNYIENQNGSFHWNSNTKIISDKEFVDVVNLLKSYPILKENSTTKSHKNSLKIVKKNFPKNKYELIVSSNEIILNVGSKEAAFNGITSLLQLIWLNKNHPIPAVKIIDEPRFEYRGLHLDVSRHFLPVDFIKKYLDVMALYKFNQFHWHLTDGPGWRLEIKKYPLLTDKAAWRNYTEWKDWWENGRQYVDRTHPNAYGGFYTQNEAKEIVKYATKKGINVIPEIEMPGHSEEVLAVYPHLSCKGIPYSSSEFCIGNPETLPFLKNILDEVLAIFPSKYIHVGGDEAEHNNWKQCPKCQGLIKKEGLKDEYELQSYLMKHIDQYLSSKGRIMVGWDEILEGGLSEGATVMSWRGEDGGIKAAEMGHDVIMTPGKYLYLDQYQSDPSTQPPALGGYLPIQQVYSYNPVPESLSDNNKKHILGAQGNVWAEWMPTASSVEYMVFPRALAVSEINWTNEESKNYDDFQKRLQSHYPILNDLGLNFYRPSYAVFPKIKLSEDRTFTEVKLESEQINPVIRFTTNGENPTKNSELYSKSLNFKGKTTLKSAIFMGDVRVVKIRELIVDYHKAIDKKVTYIHPWQGYPAQKEATLTNGLPGGSSYGDLQWQAFGGKGLSVIIDMEKNQTYKELGIRFMQQSGVGIYFPGKITVSISNDNKNFEVVNSFSIDKVSDNGQQKVNRFEIDMKGTSGRYIKVEADNPMRGYIFTDEIMVY